MGYVQLIQQVQALPPEKQAEVFDFVDFLVQRSAATQSTTEAQATWNDSEFAGMAMAQALRGMEDEVALYSTTDLQERWQ